jgi:hypothetical protein
VRDENAQRLLTKVMGWQDPESILHYVPVIQLLASHKYDGYQRFAPGKRFVESLALWLNQFDPGDRQAALDFVLNRLVFISEGELSHLVQHAYPDVIVQERVRTVAEEQAIPAYCVGRICAHPRFTELQHKSLYLGLSDGARTNELRRFSYGEISNEQIWQAYELGDAKAEDMLDALNATIRSEEGALSRRPTDEEIQSAFTQGDHARGIELLAALRAQKSEGPQTSKFAVIWLIDDFSGSGNTYIRFDPKTGRFKGKIKKIYERLGAGDLVDTTHYEVFLLLYVATRQAIDHIEYWAERFTSENNFRPLQLRVLSVIEPSVALTHATHPKVTALLTNPKYYDKQAFDCHIEVGGTTSAQMGFANCALPVVLAHNTPNNSVYILWGPESLRFRGLFPRISRHKES